jgi:uncharacterized protein (DUF1810 family)
MSRSDPHDLQRFLDAQRDVFDEAVAELRQGRKRGHWMWFVFPQRRGLGRSAMADHYGIGSLEEARAYLRHPVLGPRLVTATRAVLDGPGTSLREIFGSPDDLKFCSCMELFAEVSGEGGCVFAEAARRFCGRD